MTALELSQAVGKRGTILSDSIRVQVLIMDGKMAYGNARYLITPVSGSGQTWVNADRVQIEQEEAQS